MMFENLDLIFKTKKIIRLVKKLLRPKTRKPFKSFSDLVVTYL